MWGRRKPEQGNKDGYVLKEDAQQGGHGARPDGTVERDRVSLVRYSLARDHVNHVVLIM